MKTIVELVKEGLEATFPELTIYQEQTTQGFKEPALVVLLITATHSPMISGRYEQKANLVIRYFLKSSKLTNKDHNRQLQEKAFQLFDACQDLSTSEGVLQGYEMGHELVDGVLHFLVSFDLYYEQKKDEPLMRLLEQQINQKEGK